MKPKSTALYAVMQGYDSNGNPLPPEIVDLNTRETDRVLMMFLFNPSLGKLEPPEEPNYWQTLLMNRQREYKLVPESNYRFEVKPKRFQYNPGCYTEEGISVYDYDEDEDFLVERDEYSDCPY